jgi:hypothetical protein
MARQVASCNWNHVRALRDLVFLEGGLGLGVKAPVAGGRQRAAGLVGLFGGGHEVDAVEPEPVERVEQRDGFLAGGGVVGVHGAGAG